MLRAYYGMCWKPQLSHMSREDEDSNALIAVFWSMVRALTSGWKQILNVESATVRPEPWDLVYETSYPFSARKLKTLTVFSSESRFVSQLISKSSRFFNWLPFSFNYSVKAFSKRGGLSQKSCGSTGQLYQVASRVSGSHHSKAKRYWVQRQGDTEECTL